MTPIFSITREIANENDLVKEFSNYGKVAGFKFVSQDKRIALLQMSNVSEAIESLIVSQVCDFIIIIIL